MLGSEYDITVAVVMTSVFVVCDYSVGVTDTPMDIRLDIDGVPRCFGDGQAKV